MAAALERQARESGVSKGEIVRQAIADRLQHANSLAVMSRYFGIMRGPADLSTNTTYRRVWRKKRR